MLLPIKNGLDTFQDKEEVGSGLLEFAGLKKGIVLLCIAGSIWCSHMLCTMGSSCVVCSVGCAACSADTPNIHDKSKMGSKCILQDAYKHLVSFIVNITH